MKTIINCHCGNIKSKGHTQCRNCDIKQRIKLRKQRPIKDYILENSASRAKYNDIRRDARQTLLKNNSKKECHICDFSFFVEVCHIKPISSFPTTALMGEVNSLTNLVYLCPNHHKMLDKGALSLLKKEE
tara:strand:- start:1056 stop:1445 length:390 start_codon:yes stop_codon:yes gene_type:complete